MWPTFDHSCVRSNWRKLRLSLSSDKTAARCNQHTKQNTKSNVDEITSNKAKHGKMKADNNNKKPKVMKEQPYRHKYSFDATLKRSIPVVNAEEQVRAIVVCWMKWITHRVNESRLKYIHTSWHCSILILFSFQFIIVIKLISSLLMCTSHRREMLSTNV